VTEIYSVINFQPICTNLVSGYNNKFQSNTLNVAIELASARRQSFATSENHCNFSTGTKLGKFNSFYAGQNIWQLDWDLT